jgi:hypothetical protein
MVIRKTEKKKKKKKKKNTRSRRKEGWVRDFTNKGNECVRL